MPAKSKAQKTTAGIARGIQKGEVKPKKGSPSAKMAKTMTPTELRHLAKPAVKKGGGKKR